MRPIRAGATSNVVYVFLQDSSSATGAGLANLTPASAGLTVYYKRSNGSAAVAVTLANIPTLGTFVSGGFKAVDNTNMPGLYEFHPPDAAVAAGLTPGAVAEVTFFFRGATNLADTPVRVPLVAHDPQDAVRLGLSALPNAAAEAAGGLYTRGTGPGQVGQSVNGTLNVNLTHSVGEAVTNEDFTIASSTASTLTLPTTYSNGGAVPDDARYEYSVFQVVGGVGVGQFVLTTTRSGVRTFNVLAGTMPVQLQSTSKVVVVGTWQAPAASGSIASEVAAVKAKTDLLAFVGGRVDANLGSWKGVVPLSLSAGYVQNLGFTLGYKGANGLAESVIFDGTTPAASQGQTSINPGGTVAIAYANHFKDYVLVIEDGNSGITFATRVVGSTVSPQRLLLADPVPSVGGTDPIPFLLLPPGSSAAGERNALGLGSANLDAQFATLPTVAQMADGLIARNIDGGSNGGRTVGYYLQGGTNKVVIDEVGGTFALYRADDATILVSGTRTRGATNLGPLSSMDPA